MIIGIDRDYRTKKYNKESIRRMQSMGIILRHGRTRKTKHGYHWDVKITHDEVLNLLWLDPFYKFELRFWLGDDPIRVLKDVFKFEHGYRQLDILFSKKWRGW